MRIEAHVALGHPNGQRTRAGHTFFAAAATYTVTEAQYVAIAADPAIAITRVESETGGAPTKKELLAEAATLGIEGMGDRTKNDDIAAAIEAKRAEIAAKAAADDVSRASQGETAAEQEAKDAQ